MTSAAQARASVGADELPRGLAQVRLVVDDERGSRTRPPARRDRSPPIDRWPSAVTDAVEGRTWFAANIRTLRNGTRSPTMLVITAWPRPRSPQRRRHTPAGRLLARGRRGGRGRDRPRAGSRKENHADFAGVCLDAGLAALTAGSAGPRGLGRASSDAGRDRRRHRRRSTRCGRTGPRARSACAARRWAGCSRSPRPPAAGGDRMRRGDLPGAARGARRTARRRRGRAATRWRSIARTPTASPAAIWHATGDAQVPWASTWALANGHPAAAAPAHRPRRRATEPAAQPGDPAETCDVPAHGTWHEQTARRPERRDRRVPACPRLVAWREQVARDRRRAFADQEYWGRAGAELRRSPCPDPDRRARPRRPRRQPHRAHVHRRPQRRRARGGAPPCRARRASRHRSARDDGLQLVGCRMTADRALRATGEPPDAGRAGPLPPYLAREIDLVDAGRRARARRHRLGRTIAALRALGRRPCDRSPASATAPRCASASAG